MYSRSGWGRTDSDSTRGASGWLGHRLHLELDLLAGGERLLLEDRLQRLVDLLAVGFGHVDVGQHLLDRVALLQAQRELVAVALAAGSGSAGCSGGVGGQRLEALEALEIGGAIGAAAPARATGGRTAIWRGSGVGAGGRAAMLQDSTECAKHQSAPRVSADGADGEQDRPEQRKSADFWHFPTGPTERGNPS